MCERSCEGERTQQHGGHDSSSSNIENLVYVRTAPPPQHRIDTGHRRAITRRKVRIRCCAENGGRNTQDWEVENGVASQREWRRLVQREEKGYKERGVRTCEPWVDSDNVCIVRVTIGHYPQHSRQSTVVLCLPHPGRCEYRLSYSSPKMH